MENDELKDYVHTERLRGVADEALRGELLGKGWSKEQIAPYFKPSGIISSVARFGGDVFTVRATLAGLVLMLVSTGLLYRLYESGHIARYEQAVFGCFLLAHVVNIVACSSLAISLWGRSRHVAYRLLLGVSAFAVLLFAVSSVIHFLSIASSVPFFEMITKPLGAEGALLFVYFILLPLQAVVYLALIITLACMHYLKKRQGIQFPVRSQVIPLLVFLLIALIGIGDFVIVLDSGF